MVLRSRNWLFFASTLAVGSLITAVGMRSCYRTANDGRAPEFKRPAPVPKLVVRANSIGMKLVLLNGGTFEMGNKRFSDTRPVHFVTLSPFWIGQYEVTNEEFDHYLKRPRPPESEKDRQPVSGVTWQEADAFCKWLSENEHRQYRLPTEAEWEYAARGGLVQKDYPWGNGSPKGRATLMASKTTPVGRYRPNRYGLYDMSGNAGELVADWYDEHYYLRSPEINPKGPETGDIKVWRGGIYGMTDGRVWPRWPALPEFRVPGRGFRVVLEPALGEVKASFR